MQISAETKQAEEECHQMTRQHGRDIERPRLEQACGSLRQWGDDMVNGNIWTPTSKMRSLCGILVEENSMHLTIVWIVISRHGEGTRPRSFGRESP